MTLQVDPQLLQPPLNFVGPLPDTREDLEEAELPAYQEHERRSSVDAWAAYEQVRVMRVSDVSDEAIVQAYERVLRLDDWHMTDQDYYDYGLALWYLGQKSRAQWAFEQAKKLNKGIWVHSLLTFLDTKGLEAQSDLVEKVRRVYRSASYTPPSFWDNLLSIFSWRKSKMKSYLGHKLPLKKELRLHGPSLRKNNLS